MTDFYPSDVSALITAVQSANDGDVIHLAANTTYEFTAYDNEDYWGANALPLLDKRLTIHGNNATLKRNSASEFRLLKFAAGGHLILTDVTIRDFLEDDAGGAILSHDDNDITINNANFINNRSSDWDGGAISISDSSGKIAILNSLFDSNQAGYGESSGYGGALSIRECDAPQVIITNCIFTNNTAEEGGAVYTQHLTGTRVTIEACTFTNNSATDGVGGGLVCENGDWDILIKRCVFEDNEAEDEGFGGGAYIEYIKFAKIEYSSFVNNVAGSGGGLYIAPDYTTIIDCVFDGNTASSTSYGGGGIFAYSSYSTRILSTTFKDNQAVKAPALAEDHTDESHVNYCTFSNNTDLSDQPIAVIETDSGNPDYRHNCWNGALIPDDINYLPYMAGCDGPILQEREVPAELTETVTEGGDTCYGQSNDGQETPNPISLRKGEKRLKATDFQLATAQGELAFHRAYRQSTQTERDFMGRGWSHNHHYILDHSNADEIIVDMPESKIHLYKSHNVDANTVRYQGAGGATIYIDEDTSSSPSTYQMVASDRTLTEFAESLGGSRFGLTSRQMANGDAWYYHYNSGDLVLVHDDPGFNGTDESNIHWALRFAYYSTSDFKDGKLWRVGIKQTTSLTGTPSGPYVEFDYAEQSGAGVYLTRVRDVRNYGKVRPTEQRIGLSKVTAFNKS